MEFALPITSTLVSGVFAFLLGVLWYHPKVLGTRWLEARGGSAMEIKPVWRTVILSLMLWIVAACFYSFLADLLNITDVPGFFSLSCLLWVAFAMPPLLMGALYTGYAFEAVSIDAAYQLAGYYVFALVHVLLDNIAI